MSKRRDNLLLLGAPSLLVLAWLGPALLTGCANVAEPVEQPGWARTLMDDPPEFDLSERSPKSRALEEYREYYGLRDPVEHHYGVFESDGYTVACQALVPESPRGTVLFMHGFMDHFGLAADFVNHCLAAGFAVAGPDLPGHGLSSGARGDIDDFTRYTAVLDEVLSRAEGRLPKPWHAAGHSMGGAVLTTHLLRRKNTPLDRVVLFAPLVRFPHWRLTRLGYPVAKLVTERFRRRFQPRSGDERFIQFQERDPLAGRWLALRWVDSVYDWERRISSLEPEKREILVIQGMDDDVVDWRHNVKFLREKFDRARVVTVPDARHQIINEIPEIRERVFAEALEYLSEGGGTS
ncbi:MAG: alpha/beta hydrolase [Desulfatibacillaceae bacterium]